MEAHKTNTQEIQCSFLCSATDSSSPSIHPMVKQVSNREFRTQLLSTSIHSMAAVRAVLSYYLSWAWVLMKAVRLLLLLFKYDNGIKIMFLKWSF